VSIYKPSDLWTAEDDLLFEVLSFCSRINPTTLKNILVGLERHNRIIYDKDGSIVWIAVDTPRAQQSLRESVLLR
jgi:hypothetical protein